MSTIDDHCGSEPFDTNLDATQYGNERLARLGMSGVCAIIVSNGVARLVDRHGKTSREVIVKEGLPTLAVAVLMAGFERDLADIIRDASAMVRRGEVQS